VRDTCVHHPRPPLPPSAPHVQGRAAGGRPLSAPRGGRGHGEHTKSKITIVQLERGLTVAEKETLQDETDVGLTWAAARMVQSCVRMWQQRKVYKRERKEKLFSLKLVVKWKASLLSERNMLWTNLCQLHGKESVIQNYVDSEGDDCVQHLAAMKKKEAENAATEEAQAAAQLDRILNHQAAAEKEQAEAEAAAEKLDKEKGEALEWREKVRVMEIDVQQFQAMIDLKGDTATESEQQRLKSKIAILDKMKGRAGREWDQYEHAYKVWVKERDEAVEAVQVAHASRAKWEQAKASVLKSSFYTNISSKFSR
jgi:hypothetical protein